MGTGQEFAKNIRPIGWIMFLGIGMLVTAICFTSGSNPLPGYVAPHTSEYYSENLPELQAELEQNVLPNLSGGAKCHVSGNVIVIDIKESSFAMTRGAILKYYDKKLFEFQKTE